MQRGKHKKGGKRKTRMEEECERERGEDLMEWLSSCNSQEP